MGKSKKPFIDRKKSSTYHLLHRSQRDVANDVSLEEGATNASGMVLWPSGNNNSETDAEVLQESERMGEWREKLSELGLLDDDPTKYLKSIEGTGTFLDAKGHVANPHVDASALRKQEDAGLMEVNRQMESIPLSTEFMDEDIADVLFGDFEEGDLEELNDEFVLDAARIPVGEDEADAFDYDDHIRILMEKAKLERDDETEIPDQHVGKSDQNFFSSFTPLDEGNEDDDSFANIASHRGDVTVATVSGVVPALNPEEERALCEKFEEALLEYDSDELADCPEEEIRGTMELEGDVQLEAAMDNFLAEKDDDVFMAGNRHLQKKTGGSGFAVLSGKQMVSEASMGADEGPRDTIAETLRAAKETLAQPLQQPPTEEILIDGKSYFSERERNPWDCESILSTYSNLDNNPTTIGASRRRHRKKGSKMLASNDEEPDRIRLSDKTGLPLATDPAVDDEDDDDEFDDTIISVNRGIARNKKETPSEKRARKAAVKQQREMARIQKKITREVFQEEFQKRSIDVGVDDVAGRTVFRYS